MLVYEISDRISLNICCNFINHRLLQNEIHYFKKYHLHAIQLQDTT